jgi:hypothetical protein
MAGVTRIPRSRGGVSGVLLILLGAWGGLAPFVGPYFHFAYTPDKAWAYTSGRLYLSIVPGAAALLGGLLVVSTAHRGVGILGSLLAALGGVWFIVGHSVVVLVLKNGSVRPGFPLAGSLGPLSSAIRQFLEGLGFFTGVGILILFFAALALGRFSVVGVKDAALAESLEPSMTEPFPTSDRLAAGETSYPISARGTGQFPTAGHDQAAEPAPTAAEAEQPATTEEQYPATTTSPFDVFNRHTAPPSDPGPS